jgi:hypothetical protein
MAKDQAPLRVQIPVPWSGTPITFSTNNVVGIAAFIIVALAAVVVVLAGA